MSFSVKEKLPGIYFQEAMDAKTELVRMYLDDLDYPLIFSHYCGIQWQPLDFTLAIVRMLPPTTLYFF